MAGEIRRLSKDHFPWLGLGAAVQFVGQLMPREKALAQLLEHGQERQLGWFQLLSQDSEIADPEPIHPEFLKLFVGIAEGPLRDDQTGLLLYPAVRLDGVLRELSPSLFISADGLARIYSELGSEPRKEAGRRPDAPADVIARLRAVYRRYRCALRKKQLQKITGAKLITFAKRRFGLDLTQRWISDNVIRPVHNEDK
jgi:hypothetical protein